MALILEVLDGKHGGVQSRVRLDALPLTLGRSYENDLVLDDPYVDGTHARIVADDAGTTMIEDLGSVNGLGTPGRPGRQARLALTAGIEIRIGRTTLRVRDTADPVPAARPDPTAHALPAASRWGWIDSAGGRLAVSAAAILAIAVHAWLGSYSRTGASDATGAAMAYVLLAAIWAGIWAIAGRVVVHRFNFLAHFAVASVVAPGDPRGGDPG